MIVVMDYFTKWIAIYVLTNITIVNVMKFFKRNILSKFGVPQAIMTDSKTKCIDRWMTSLLEELRIKQHFTSVEHPQTNGQAGATNEVLVRGLKRRLEGAKSN